MALFVTKVGGVEGGELSPTGFSQVKSMNCDVGDVICIISAYKGAGPSFSGFRAIAPIATLNYFSQGGDVVVVSMGVATATTVSVNVEKAWMAKVTIDKS